MIPTTERHDRIIREVRELLASGVPLPDALQSVQRIENSASLGDDLEYGPFTNVTRIWQHYEREQEQTLRAQLEASLHRDRFYDDPSMPCETCGGAGCRCQCGAA